MTWTIYLRNRDLQRVGQIDDFQSLELIPRFNDVGSWVLDIDRRTALANLIIQPGYGIEVVRDDEVTVLAGPFLGRKRKRDVNSNRLTLSGVDDNVWLNRRLAHPQPGSAAPPYSSTEYDVRTGQASGVLRDYVAANLGSTAVSERQVPLFAMGADPVAGSTVTGRARWQVLLELLVELAQAGGGLGFKLAQVGTTLQFDVFQPEDKSTTIKFSEDLGNLVGYSYDSDAPVFDYVFCGGGGEGTARTIREGPDSESMATWGRIEAFRDRRDTTVTAELDQEISSVLAENAEKQSLSIEPIDITGQQYITHYSLGDRVTAVIDGEPVQEIIRSVRIVLSPEGPQKVLPEIGAPGRTSILRIFDRLMRAENRIRQLERR